MISCSCSDATSVAQRRLSGGGPAGGAAARGGGALGGVFGAAALGPQRGGAHAGGAGLFFGACPKRIAGGGVAGGRGASTRPLAGGGVAGGRGATLGRRSRLGASAAPWAARVPSPPSRPSPGPRECLLLHRRRRRLAPTTGRRCWSRPRPRPTKTRGPLSNSADNCKAKQKHSDGLLEGLIQNGYGRACCSDLRTPSLCRPCMPGYLKAVWPEFVGSVFGVRAAPGGHSKMWGAKPPTFLDGLKASRGRPDPKNRPNKFRPDCLQVPRHMPGSRAARLPDTRRTRGPPG